MVDGLTASMLCANTFDDGPLREAHRAQFIQNPYLQSPKLLSLCVCVRALSKKNA